MSNLFSDKDILFYAIDRGFVDKNSMDNNILNNSLVSIEDIDKSDELIKAVNANPNYKLVADYVAYSFSNPEVMLKVFLDVDDRFLRFRCSLPQTKILNPEFAMIYSAGEDGGFLGFESKETFTEILLENLKINNEVLNDSIKFNFPPRFLLVILAACDAIIAGKIEGGWFSASSIINSLNNLEEQDFNRICSPLADVMSEHIHKYLAYEDVQIILKDMVKQDILQEDVVDGISIYCFGAEYKNLPLLFFKITSRSAIYKYDSKGNFGLYYFIKSNNENWYFFFDNDEGLIEKLNTTRFKEIITNMLKIEKNQSHNDKAELKRFCIYCGSQLNNDSVFCMNCGKKIS